MVLKAFQTLVTLHDGNQDGIGSAGTPTGESVIDSSILLQSSGVQGIVSQQTTWISSFLNSTATEPFGDTVIDGTRPFYVSYRKFVGPDVVQHSSAVEEMGIWWTAFGHAFNLVGMCTFHLRCLSTFEHLSFVSIPPGITFKLTDLFCRFLNRFLVRLSTRIHYQVLSP